MISLDQLTGMVEPERTTLLMGSGAAISSGGLTDTDLARSLSLQLDPPPEGNDLAEICSIYEYRLGRPKLVSSIRDKLHGLEPAGGLLALPAYRWRAIFTANFDQLIEKSYQAARANMEVVRSSFDFSNTSQTIGAAMPIYKLHGCISDDIAFSNHGRVQLTERDYDELEGYRKGLFQALGFCMTTTDTLLIGNSLRDLRLRELAKKVADLRNHQGGTGQVYVLSYQEDPDRAMLLEQKGFQVAFGGLDAFLHALAHRRPIDSKVVYSSDSSSPSRLPPEVSTVTVDVAQASAMSSNAARLFNGSPATYADISDGLTISRAVERRLLDTQAGDKGIFLSLIGVAGVGKTSLARRLLFEQQKTGSQCWEHREAFPLDVDAWAMVEASLRASNKRAFLLIDDCVQRMAALNKLVEKLGRVEDPHLRLVLTANKNQWQSRMKSPFFFSRGRTENLSRLTELDLEQLVNLVERQPSISRLVEQQFARLSRPQRIRRLRDRCSAEMYVCLKNIFGSERLDDILLREFAELQLDEQDIYRHVAVLQAMGGKVHRQLILRLLGVDSSSLAAILTRLDGIIAEYDIKPRDGLYGWAARHDVIARVIATYKFTDTVELYNLIERLIEGINPAVGLELDTARAICAHERGIPGLPDPNDQITLLKKMIIMLPGERTPRRRLIRKFLDIGELDSADQEIQVATEEIGKDSVIDRYRVGLALQRAEATPGIMDEDRLAMLKSAQTLALQCATENSNDRYNYRILCEVAVAIMRRSQDSKPLEEAIERMRDAELKLLDPELSRDRRHFEQMYRTHIYLGSA
jgi:hypothetical protein